MCTKGSSAMISFIKAKDFAIQWNSQLSVLKVPTREQIFESKWHFGIWCKLHHYITVLKTTSAHVLHTLQPKYRVLEQKVPSDKWSHSYRGTWAGGNIHSNKEICLLFLYVIKNLIIFFCYFSPPKIAQEWKSESKTG